MIKKAFIASNRFNEFSGLGDFELVLAQDLDNPIYCKKIAGRIIYLDNGAHEKKFAGIDWLLRQIDKLPVGAVRLVFAPDDMTSGRETSKLVKTFIGCCKLKYGDQIPFKIAAIPHGETIHEYLKYFNEFVQTPEISMIGLSYIDPPKYWPKKSMCDARKQLLQRLGDMQKKPCHLLGGSDGFSDVKYASNLEWVDSWDSSSPFMHGYLGERYQEVGNIKGGKVKTLDPSIKELTPKQKEHILYNVKFLKKNLS